MAEYRRRFLSLARQSVLHQLISGWKRRGSSLLQVGLDAGFSPEFFWEAGFDVTALDRSGACLSAARASDAPNTTPEILDSLIAPVHMRHGSSVTTSTQPERR